MVTVLMWVISLSVFQSEFRANLEYFEKHVIKNTSLFWCRLCCLDQSLTWLWVFIFGNFHLKIFLATTIFARNVTLSTMINNSSKLNAAFRAHICYYLGYLSWNLWQCGKWKWNLDVCRNSYRSSNPRIHLQLN